MLHDLVQRAADSPPFDGAAAPETVVLVADRRSLRLTWPSGEDAEIAAERLRAACRCAWCTRARIDGTFPADFDAVAVDRLALIGGYALNIAFSDGHARGIYPWPYLRALAKDVTAALPRTASNPCARSPMLERS
jgi:prepilin-type processing-associated H-X9-DG protein